MTLPIPRYEWIHEKGIYQIILCIRPCQFFIVNSACDHSEVLDQTVRCELLAQYCLSSERGLTCTDTDSDFAAKFWSTLNKNWVYKHQKIIISLIIEWFLIFLQMFSRTLTISVTLTWLTGDREPLRRGGLPRHKGTLWKDGASHDTEWYICLQTEFLSALDSSDIRLPCW